MATVVLSVYVGDRRHYSGKTINVYDTYAHALSHAATGLMTIYGITELTGAAGAAITQVAKTTGVVADENGVAHFAIDDGAECFLMSNDQWGLPRRVKPA